MKNQMSLNTRQRMNTANVYSGASPAKQSGFTLIEIAIVLVIIGLLLGGVLKGQELINTARVRALNNNVDGITSAWFSFSDRYRAFPGDYLLASVNLPGAPANGDGTGIVGQNGTGGDVPAERGLAWQHLQAAGYITGNFDGGAVTVNDFNCITTRCPDNGFGQGMVINYGSLQQAGAGGVAAHELLTGRAVPSDVLAELDRKIDDGTAGAGSMQLGLGGVGWAAGQLVTACQNVNVPGAYNIQTPSANCAAVFRNF